MALTNREKFLAQQAAARDRQAKQQPVNEMTREPYHPANKPVSQVDEMSKQLREIKAEMLRIEEHDVKLEIKKGCRLFFDLTGTPQLTNGRPVDPIVAQKLITEKFVAFEQRIESRGNMFCAVTPSNYEPLGEMISKDLAARTGLNLKTGRYSDEAVRAAALRHCFK